MTKTFLKESFLWGVILWLFGYLLSFILFFLVPASLLGWIITPFGIAFTLWVLIRKIVAKEDVGSYLLLGTIWAALAVVLDFIFIVKLLNPVDGYYKPDVFLYYGTTVFLPVLYWFFSRRKKLPS